MMATFLLVHGSWHDGNAWKRVVAHLEQQGHTAFAPTIAGHGKGVNKQVSHAQCTQSIVDFIVTNHLTDFVLVGHSFGGTIITKVAEVIPERIRRLVFYDAFVLKDGGCVMDDSPPFIRALFEASTSPDRSALLPFPVWREAFINDANLEMAQWSYKQLSPEPYQPFIDRLDMKKFYSLHIPASYLNCTEDIGAFHPTMSTRLGLFRLLQMPGSHEVIFSNPIGLADKLIEAGRD
jgi:pimeloyl-ACP methyl ester carboxylesterase